MRCWGRAGRGRAARNIRITEGRTRLPQRWGIKGRLRELRRVRALLDSYKERGEQSAFLTSPSSSPLLPFLPLSLFRSFTRPLILFSPLASLSHRFILNLLTERILGDSPQMWSACFLFLYRLPFTYDYYTANCSLLQVSVLSLGVLSRGEYVLCLALYLYADSGIYR